MAASRRLLCEADVDLIREVVSWIMPPVFVANLGAGEGTTSLALIAEGKDLFCLNIDSDAEKLAWGRRALMNADAELQQFRFWEGISYEIPSRYIANEDKFTPPFEGDVTFDLVIVDASHEYEDVRRDIKAWLPYVAAGGYLIFHDYDAWDAPHQYPGVKKAVDEVINMGQLRTVKRQGWSILCQKE